MHVCDYVHPTDASLSDNFLIFYSEDMKLNVKICNYKIDFRSSEKNIWPLQNKLWNSCYNQKEVMEIYTGETFLCDSDIILKTDAFNTTTYGIKYW
jgi:hypothetical protein